MSYPIAGSWLADTNEGMIGNVMSRRWWLALVMFIPAIARADVRGTYRRVGGWQYVDREGVMSCGAEVRKKYAAILARGRVFEVRDTEIVVNHSDEGYPIRERKRNQIDAELRVPDEYGVKVSSITILEGDNGDSAVVFSRAAFGKGDDHTWCADFWQASLDRDAEDGS